MDRFSLEVKVGLVVTVAVGLVLAFIFILSDWNPLTNTYKITMTLNYAGGIKPGSDVQVAGAKVGKVDAIRFMSAPGGGEAAPVLGLELLIDKRAKELIREDSTFSIHMESLLGGKIVEITPGSPGGPVLKEDAVVRGQDPRRLEELINEAAELLEGIKEIREGISREEKERLKDLLSTVARFGPEDADEVKRMIKNAADASQDLKEMSSVIRPELPPLLADLRAALSEARPLLSQARRLVKDLNRLMDELQEIAPDRKEDARSKAERLLSAADDLAAVARRLNRFTARMEQEFGYMDRDELERIIRDFLQQEGITINVGKIVGKPDYPEPPGPSPSGPATQGSLEKQQQGN